MAMLIAQQCYCYNMPLKTENLKDVCRRADVLIVAVGKLKLINAEYVKDGAVVIDVGMNRLENRKLCGDVDFESVLEKAYITLFQELFNDHNNADEKHGHVCRTLKIVKYSSF